jgi:hypothetical protein
LAPEQRATSAEHVKLLPELVKLGWTRTKISEQYQSIAGVVQWQNISFPS